jgi:serine/threonine-protein kinase
MADPTNTATTASNQNASGAQPDPLIGRTINERFKILSVIARGGMGKVYKAEQAPLGRICAVKVLNPNYNGENDPEFHKRFFLEASIASKLSHPNTVTIFDYGQTDDNVYFMAMEYLEGRTLHRVIKTESPLAPHRVVHIARQICRSLREAHGLGVIHRDLKPANVYLIQHDDEADFVKVLDFGLVKNVDDTSENLTQTGLFMGSPKYMAPEQIRGDRCDARTDVYALGVVMFEMLTGKVPYDGGTSVNTLMMHVNDPIPNMREIAPMAAFSDALGDVVYKCMQKKPEDRFNTMDEVLQALKRASGESGDFAASMLLSTGSLPGDTSQRGVLPNPTGSGAVPPAIVAPEATVTAGSSAIPADAPKKSRMGLVLGIIGAIVIAGGIGGAMMAKSSGSTPQTNTTRTSVTPTDSTGANQPVANDAHVHVALQSNPTGAEVFEGDHSVGHTPLTLDWQGADGDPARSHTFVFRLEGHQESTVTLTGAMLEHTATLEVADAGAATAAATTGNGATTPTRNPRTRNPRNPRNGQQNGTPSGYRGIDDW